MSAGTPTDRPSVTARLRSWSLWSIPRWTLGYVLGIEVVALLVAGVAVITPGTSAADLTRAGVLLLLSIGFEEVSIRVDSLRIRLNLGIHNDMTSVWTFAAAVLSPLQLLVPLVLAIRVHVWFRVQKGSGSTPYRQVFTGATIILAAAVAHALVMPFHPASSGLPVGATALIAVLVAMVGYAAVNTGTIFGAMLIASGGDSRPRFLEIWRDKGLEAATLCLGALAALAMAFEPWLIVLVVPSMVILQRSVLTKELQVAATTDAKTGLLNAVTWHQLAERELVRAERENRTASMLIIDMDNFKLINDTYGHLAGDDVLKGVALILQDELRGYDVVGRFGGEEFVALLADVSALQALDISDRILARIRDLRVTLRDTGEETVKGLSASIGLACFPEQAQKVEDLLYIADAALYTAKREGRDRVEYSYLGA